jgi:hypothetical protein
MGAFRRGLTISPFQIPLLAYLFLEGALTATEVPALSRELELEHQWPLWNFVIALIVGAGLATVSRFNANERLEEFGLWLTALAVIIAAGIQVTAHEYSLGDEIAILLGCWLRIRVLRRSRKAERIAIKIATDNEGDTP